MTNRTELPLRPRRGLPASAAILAGALAACGPTTAAETESPEQTGGLQASIWANSPGVRATAQILPWETVVGSGAYSQPAVAAYAQDSDGPNFMHVFFFDANQCLRHYTGFDWLGTWTKDTSTPYCEGFGAGSPSAVAWDATGRVDVFWFYWALADGSTSLMHRWMDGGKWYTENLGATAVPAASDPAVASWGTGHLDVFWRDANNRLKWRGFDRSKRGASGYTATGWFAAERAVASNVTGDPTAVERTANIIDLFWRDSSGVLKHQYSGNGGSTWSGALSLNVSASTAPSATSWGQKRIDVVYGVDSNHLGHLWIDGSTGSWDPRSETLASNQTLHAPVAASAPGRPGRIDVFASPSGTALSHTLFQESLPGYEVVRQPNSYWCWAAVASSVIDYVYTRKYGLQYNIEQCSLVNLQLDRTDCCAINPANKINGFPNLSPCLHSGNVEDLLDYYQISFSTVDPPMPAAFVKSWLWYSHQPIISHHSHSDGSGHYVVITDMYELNGQNMVVISDPNSGNYVEVYEEYLSNPCGTGLPGLCGTTVDYQIYNFSR